MSVRPWLLAVAFLGGLSACTVFPQPEPYQVYVLPSAPPEASDAAAINQSLRLETPRASRTLASTRLLVMPSEQQLSAYENARWADLAPVLVRDHLIEAFREHGRLRAVVDEESRVNARIELVSDLRAFHIEYVNGTPEARIRLDAQLIHAGRFEALATRRFEVREVSSGTSLDAVVSALGRAADELAMQLMEWSYQYIPES
ncbi:ABC-type transport auxiliary lipoprotein family protein [Marinimicrobium sp. ABcell2]|uniref:ABC-type transport auxiliary lipoprotein family protein n=1 Tax=Marinimicrobium sp. ABcell2 TaxID=3069751 RepID=UPI0027AE2EAE|nr:ABC-type transport auxiliary lipoprotein family protein [Marinimicrobium sp. ABcell2]MDQ2076785.1 ABC-type transport auxiliary lipoprotein family protein [Marinimicrobium sp. ABcell2]